MRQKDGHLRKSSSVRAAFTRTALIVLIIAIVATAYILLRLRAEAINRQFDAASMYALAFADHLTQSFNAIDLTLASTSDPARTSAPLVAALRHAPYLRSLSLLGPDGSIVASSDPGNVGIRIAKGDFLPPTTEPRAVLRAGPPWVGRDFHDGRPTSPGQPAAPDALDFVPVLRDSIGNDGHWHTLLAAVNTDYFLNYYGRSFDTNTGTVELLRYDGTLLLSTDEGLRPGTRSDADIVRRVAQKESGRFEQPLRNDRTALTAYRASGVYPFIIVVRMDKDAGLAGWRQEAESTLAVVSALLLLGLALSRLYFVRLERAELQRRRAVDELRLRSSALEAAANAIIITDRQGNIEWTNSAFCALTGYTADEAQGRNPRELFKSETQAGERYADLWRTILAGEVWRGELINRRKDGSHYHEDQTITPVRDKDGDIRHFIAVKQDVTERKEAEQRMQDLSRHLVVVQESARRRLSGELHDRTSPNLAAIAINLDIIAATFPAERFPDITERLDDIRALTDDATASIREICADLRPPVLDYAGLPAALEGYARQFTKRTGIAVLLDCTQRDVRLAPELESMLFRIVQEALTNCAKHARAASIVVSLRLEDGPIALTAVDDGVGFDPDLLGKTTHTGGLGILTMREMAEFFGGRLSIESRPGHGTRIHLEIDPQGIAA